MSLKIKDESGKVVGVLEDDASEPEMVDEKETCSCSCHDKTLINCDCKERGCKEGDKE